jgi:CRISPR-associated protein Cmr3
VSWLSITPRDPIVARDGRPFSATQRRMRSLDWPYPSVLAGSLRTLLGKLADLEFTARVSQGLREIEVAGPLPAANGHMYFPAPADIVVNQERAVRSWFAVRPRDPERGGANLPLPRLLPAMLRRGVDDFKPVKGPAFWSLGTMVQWLLEDPEFAAPPQPDHALGGAYLRAPLQDRRTHVAIEATTGTAMESRLFQTTGLDFDEGLTMAARAENVPNDLAPFLDHLDALHPIGGERRLAHWKPGIGDLWNAPGAVEPALAGSGRVRMILATPAIFTGGWLPGWVNQDLSCVRAGVTMRLVGAAIQRWRPISGWNLESSETSRPGPKKIKRAVPAGGVYFFEVEHGDPAELARLWLQPMSDEPQDCRDGFGLALWGPWSDI